jgi:hypothetical protein
MLNQGVTKQQMKEIMRMWTQISLIHLKISITPAQQPDENQQQPQPPQQPPNIAQTQHQLPGPGQQQQAPAPPVPPVSDPTQKGLNRLMAMLRQYPHYMLKQ